MDKKKPKGVTVLGIFLLLCVMPGLMLAFIGLISGPANPQGALGKFLDTFTRIIFAFSPIICLVAGIGVLKLKKWVRVFYLWIPLFILIALGLTASHHLPRSESVNRIYECQKIKGPITRTELIDRLGNPIYEKLSDKGLVLHFKSNTFAAGPIRALIDPKTNMLIGIKCSEDGEWEYFT